MIKGVGHINFGVLDMDKATEFFCNVLDLKKAFDIINDAGKVNIRYLMLPDKRFIELSHAKAADGDAPTHGTFRHISLEVDDIEEMEERVRKSGRPIAGKGIKRGKDLNYQFFSTDVDGNKIEFMQMDENSPQRKSQRELL